VEEEGLGGHGPKTGRSAIEEEEEEEEEEAVFSFNFDRRTYYYELFSSFDSIRFDEFQNTSMRRSPPPFCPITSMFYIALSCYLTLLNVHNWYDVVKEVTIRVNRWVFLLMFMSMGLNYVSELRPAAGLLFMPWFRVTQTVVRVPPVVHWPLFSGTRA
jgi:hypothetical protein